jgi:hypothetical protein
MMNELRIDPELQMRLESLRSFPVRDSEKASLGRARFLAEADSLEQPVSIGRVQRLINWINNIQNKILSHERYPMLSKITAIFFVGILVLSGAGVTAAAAQDALPGDLLYPVKTMTESAQLLFAQEDIQDIELQLQFADMRLNEMAELITDERWEDLVVAYDAFANHLALADEILSDLDRIDDSQIEHLVALMGNVLEKHDQILLIILRSAPPEILEELLSTIQDAEDEILDLIEDLIDDDIADEDDDEDPDDVDDDMEDDDDVEDPDDDDDSIDDDDDCEDPEDEDDDADDDDDCADPDDEDDEVDDDDDCEDPEDEDDEVDDDDDCEDPDDEDDDVDDDDNAEEPDEDDEVDDDDDDDDIDDDEDDDDEDSDDEDDDDD